VGKQPLRVYLLKDGYRTPEEVLRPDKAGGLPPQVHVEDLASAPAREGFVATKQHSTGEPGWWKFVAATMDAEVKALETSSASAVVVLPAGGSWFAVTFGYGRNMVRDEAIVRDFGFKVVLNRVEPDDLRSLDAHAFEEMSVHTRKSTSRGATLGAFGIDSTHDMMRAITGKSRDPDLGDMIAGSDALAVALDTTAAHLPHHCARFLSAYKSDDYKQDPRWAFIDKVRVERDPARTAELDAQLVTALHDRDFARLHLCPPEPFDWGGDFGGFTYNRYPNAECRWELDGDLLVDAMGDRLDAAVLTKMRAYARSHSSGDCVKGWPVYDCIVFEEALGPDNYVLTCGTWYRIEPDFVARVNEQAEALLRTTPSLPDATGERDEGGYNRGVAAAGSDYVLLDCKCPTIDGDSVEVCDLLSPTDRQLIHVKWWDASATLSHLFRQGANSAECLMSDDSYRAAARAKIAAERPDAVNAIPAQALDPTGYTVVFAVVYPSHRTFPSELPFFTKLNLVRTARELRRLRFDVSLVRIMQIATAPPQKRKRKRAR